MEIVEFNGEKLYKWSIGASRFILNPRRGMRLMNWFLELADGSVRDIIFWPENGDIGDNIAGVRGGNPILFPFSGKSFIKGQEGLWKTSDGKILKMPQHGLARQGNFEIIDVSDYKIVAKFLPSKEATECYPYDYDFIVTYRFDEFSISCEFALTNKSSSPIPWSAGHHFYFKMPWHEGTSRKDYRIVCDAKKAFKIDASGVLNEVDANFPADFSDPEIWNRINCKLKTNLVKFGPKNGEEDISLKVGDSPKPEAWTSVVTWSESDDSPFYCVEPWMGAPNAAEHKGGLHFVEPNSTQRFSVQVSIF